MEEICGSESEVCQEFVRENRKTIQKVITKSLSTVQKTSKGVSIILYVTKNDFISLTKNNKCILSLGTY